MFARGKQWMENQFNKLKNSIGQLKENNKNNVDLIERNKKTSMIHRTIGWFGKYKKQITISAAGIFGAIWVTGCIVVAHQHYVSVNTNEVYHVYLDGELTGTVTDPDIIDRYLQEKRAEIQQQYPDIHMDLKVNDVMFESERGFKLASDNSGTLRTLREKAKPVATGAELWINDELVAIVKDEETLAQILDRIESKYVASKGEVSVLSAHAKRDKEPEPRTTLKNVEFVEHVNVVSVETEPDEIMNEKEVMTLLEQGDTKPIQYEVQAGDCISCIAKKFDVSTEFIYEKNPWIKGEFIQIGDRLDLTVEQPALSVRTVEQYEQVVSIPYTTKYEDDDNLRIGLSEVIQQGQDGKKRVHKEIVKVNGLEAEQNVVDEEIIEQSTDQVIKKGTKVVLGIGTGTFRWPVVSPRITSGYGMRWGKLHKGLDMVSKNKNIVAADNGKVSESGYNDGYGNYVIIDHGNSYKTLYGHMSETSVSSGDILERSEEHTSELQSRGHLVC